MGSVPIRTVLVVWGMALVAPVAPGSRVASAQPGSRSAAPANAGARSTARKLVEDGIAAFNDKNYGKAIALYLRAFSLDPHPRLLFNVAQALRLAGCTERAGAFYERYLTLEPQGGESETARDVLAEIKGRHSSGSSSTSCSVAASLLESQPADSAEAKGRLKLSSKPEGVIVMLDGVKIGTTPIEREVAAGAHMVSLVDRERLVGEQRVEVGTDTVAELTIPVALASDFGRSAGRSRLPSVLLWVGGGLALAGSGVAFYYGQKGWPEDNYSYRGATETGFALASAGMVAIGIGTWLWLRDRKESAPVAAVEHGGAYFGWSGSF